MAPDSVRRRRMRTAACAVSIVRGVRNLLVTTALSASRAGAEHSGQGQRPCAKVCHRATEQCTKQQVCELGTTGIETADMGILCA